MRARFGRGARPQAPPASPHESGWALAALAAALAPFLFALPPWIATVALLLVAWRAAVLVRRSRLPPLLLRLALAAAAVVVVVVSFRGLGGAEAGGAFLVLTSALKALESRSRRDFHIVALLAFFLLAAAFLLIESLPMGLYAAAAVWLTTTALLPPAPAQAWPRLFARAGTLLLAALPVAAVFFLLFPRLPGPLFRFGAPQTAAVSGLPDQLDPGAIAALAASDTIAFRVRFDGPIPAPAERYFRGPVFQLFDGRRWLPGRAHARDGHFEPLGKPVRYHVLERASGTRYLFALSLPAQISTAAHLTATYELLAPHPLWNDVAFDALSYPRHVSGHTLGARERAATLGLPPGVDPRTRALARRWRKELDTPAAVVKKALAWFRDQPYYYTLTPGPNPGPNAIDHFMFDTRRGFCEHYASAFAVLMRAAGIPARVVTGYAGGTVNPYDDWLVLRQANAHAWDEVWLAGSGWVRIDPTSVIPPSRVESSADVAAATSPAANAPFDGGHWLWRLRDLWDALNTAWTQYVNGYGPALQQRLLGRLGLGALGPITVALVMVGAAAVLGALLIFLFLLRPMGLRGDPARRLYARWCRRMARRGLARPPSEGPLDFARRVAVSAPALAAEAADVTALYIRARYAEDAAALTRLRQRLRRRR